MFTRLTILITVIASFFAVWAFNSYQEFAKKPIEVSPENEVFLIKPGESSSLIVRRMQEKGFISDIYLVKIYLRYKGLEKKFQAGEYRLSDSMSAEDVIDTFVQGKTLKYNITIPEGWNLKQLLAELREKENIVNTLQPDIDEHSLARFLKLKESHAEGLFFPDTYQYTSGETDVEFLQRLYYRMSQVLQDQWKQRMEKLPLKTPYEALILASIIEKETGVASERQEIAGVFIRRLNKRMKLQTDPTVIYGMGDRYDGNIRRKDLREDTPHNTYVHYGLPPTPICLPGEAAIHAALNPAKGTSLYFVGKGDGSHKFSDTLEEHNKAVRKYQLGK